MHKKRWGGDGNSRQWLWWRAKLEEWTEAVPLQHGCKGLLGKDLTLPKRKKRDLPPKILWEEKYSFIFLNMDIPRRMIPIYSRIWQRQELRALWGIWDTTEGAKGFRNGEGPRMTGVRAGPGEQRRLHSCAEPPTGDGRSPAEGQPGLGLTALPSFPAFWRWLNRKPQRLSWCQKRTKA